MSRRLPPLNSVRAFEAAARHMSISKAAEELHVTPAAISRQVKLLEGHLGVQLFRRLNRALLLTHAGQACLPGLREGLDRLADAFDTLRDVDAQSGLTVSTSASLAAKWLVPRLHRFQTRYPEIDVRVSASHKLADFSRDEVDLAIRFGSGDYPGMRAERLMGEEVFPVCSPRIITAEKPLRRPADLHHHTLLHDEGYLHYVDEGVKFDEIFPDWTTWLKSAGVKDIDTNRGPRFSLSSTAIQAAIEGLGVTLGRSVLVESDLIAGLLVKPFDLAARSNFAYFIVSPPKAMERPNVIAFRDWLFDEADAMFPAQAAPARASVAEVGA